MAITSAALIYVFSLLLFVCLLLLLPCPSSSLSDTLTAGKWLTGNQTLVSADNVFEFGFFSPGNSTARYYVGVWYYNITPKAVVWVPNRQTPLADSSGRIQIKNGNLTVLDSSMNPIWSSNSTSVAQSWNSTVRIMNSSNLVVQSNDNGLEIWSSFKNPTETLVPGMTITSGMNFTSWRSPDDPSPGNFTLGLDPRGVNQLLLVENGDVIRWRTGLWDGNAFNGINRMRPLGLNGFHLTPDPSDRNQLSFDFTYINNTRMRFVLLPNGTESTYIFVKEINDWSLIWSQPVLECEYYNKCGVNSRCDDGGTPKCGCLYGFKPKSDVEWSNGNWSSGCERRTQLGCPANRTNSTSSAGGGDDGFWPLNSMKLPDLPTMSLDNETGCQEACSKNCSCTAYTYITNLGCFTWSGDLVDISKFPEDRNGKPLFIKLNSSELGRGRGRSKKRIVVAVVVPVSMGIILLICLLMCWKYKSKLKELWKTDVPVADNVNSGEQRESGSMSENREEVQTDGKSFELPMFSLECIQVATNNFSESNTLGKGGFGQVYKGTLPGGEEVAVKRLSQNSCQGLEEFKNEMILIAKLQHNNLVRLQGVCIQGYEKILIYEYMPNKSLDAFIFDSTRQTLLDWRKRFNIIEGVARGLLYLHRDSRLRIVHRDMKASNILLDEEMNPKISDFGMARIFGSNQNQDNTNRVVGTFGYMSPEYAMEGLFSVKSDVYSFGVLILEIISGRKNNRFRSEDHPNLLGYVWQLWKEERSMELVDPAMSDSCSTQEVLRCIHIALLCVQDRANDRPTMSAVVIMLGSETGIQTMPKQPTFAAAGSPDGTTTRYKDDVFSTNDVTITTLTGR